MDPMPIASLIYDFDKTLSPRDMQEYGFLPGLNIAPDAFWAECRQFAVDNQMDAVLAYMYKMHEKAAGVMRLTRETLNKLGASVEFFTGVEDWFARVNAYGASIGLQVEHYIISSGIKEIIEGSRIAHHFYQVFAASYCYDSSGLAVWPSTAVNYTSKTQHMFRINKGILDVTDHVNLNSYTPKEERRVPFSNMIYVGDGLTDVPCMKLTRAKGGASIAVHPPGDTYLVDEMLVQKRVDFAAPADYSQGSEMEDIVFALLRMIKFSDECSRLHSEHLNRARRRLDLDAGKRPKIFY
jgi:phosphoserine phosphatase